MADRRESGGRVADWARVAGLTWLSAILCSIGLGSPSMWIDEIHSYEFSSLPSAWLVVLNSAVRDAYPPLYFLLLHGWMKLGATEVWLRMSSVLPHLASIPLIYMIGARVASPGAGLLAAALLAISPFHIGFAQEARMYSLMGFLAVLSTWGLLVHWRERSHASLWVFTAAGLALLYTHVIGGLLLLVQGCWLLFLPRRAGLRPAFWKWVAVLAIGFLPWAPFFAKAFVVTGGYGSEAPVHLLVYWFAAALGAGFALPPVVIAASFATASGLAAIGFFSMPRGPKRSLVGLWAFLPLALELAANLAGKPIFGERTLIISTPAWLLLVAQAIVPGRMAGARPALGAVLAGGLAGFSYGSVLLIGLAGAPAHRDALGYVIAHARAGDVIVHSSTVTYHPVHEYYLPRSGSKLKDFMIEPQGQLRGGKLGTWFRDVWRRARPRLDPGGAIRSGADPNRVSEDDFLDKGYSRVWYFHTTEEGMRRLWYLMPSRYYAPTPDQMRTTPVSSHPRLVRALKGGPAVQFPGLNVELYEVR